MDHIPAAQVRRHARAVTAAWRAVPLRRRLEVAKLAKRGRRHPDRAAVRAAQDYARFVRRPSPRWWHHPDVRLVLAWLLVPLAGVLAVEAVLLLRWGSSVGWIITVSAVLTLATALFRISLLLDVDRLLALGEERDPARD